MWTGRQALNSLDEAVNQVRDHLNQVDSQIQASSRELVELHQQQGAHYRALAKIRLDGMVSGEIAAGLETADRRVAELLEERDSALEALQQQIEQLAAQQQGLEQQRQGQSLQLEQAAQELDRTEAEVQGQLEGNAAFQAQLDQAQRADNVAKHAEEKTKQAEADRREKGKPYENDPLFSYLWERGYETSRYSANPLRRMFDNWAARLCNFQQARPNYAMLLEIPRRLGAHARNVREAASREFEALKALEMKAAQQGGVVQSRQLVEAAEQRIDAVDAEIKQAEQQARELLQKRARFASGEDEFFQRCVEALVGAFQREKLQALEDYARATATAEDDLLVQELDDLTTNEGGVKEQLAQHKQTYQKQLDRLQELEDVRLRFKRERYDDIHSIFTNPELLTEILGQVLIGIASADDLWGSLRRGQRYRRIQSNPNFGTGGFGRGGVWRMPFPRFPRGGGWKPRSGGRSSDGSGGGFRTGGGF